MGRKLAEMVRCECDPPCNKQLELKMYVVEKGNDGGIKVVGEVTPEKAVGNDGEVAEKTEEADDRR